MMIERSTHWTPIRAFSCIGFLVAVGWALLVLGVFLFRNPATGFLAIVAVPIYLICFAAIAVFTGLAVVLIRRLLSRVSARLRLVGSALVGLAGGILIGLAFWWFIEFEAPPVFIGGVLAVLSAAPFVAYSVYYERANNQRSAR